MGKKKILKKVNYLTPVFLEVEEKIVSRMPGISSQWKWVPVPGVSCQFPPIQYIQIYDESAPQMWPYQEMAIVPPGALSPDVQVGLLVLGHQKLYQVLPLAEAQESWERIKFVLIPDSFYSYFAPHIEAHRFELKYGEYFPPEYRIKVQIPENQIAPITWTRLEE